MSAKKSSDVTHSKKERLSKILIWISIAVVFIVVLAYFGVGAVAANKLTVPKRRFPTEKTPCTFGLAYEDVEFPSRDGEADISAWYIPNPESDQAVIVVHGNNESRTYEFSGNMVDLGAAINKAGFNVLMIDLRGHGLSGEGRASFGIKERSDVLGAIDWLLEKGYQPGSIGLLGTSLGGASVIGAGHEESAVGAVVTDSTFAEIYPVIQGQWQNQSGLPNLFLSPTRLMARLMFGYDIAKSRPVEEIGDISPRPILIIHCKTDQSVPVEHAERLHAAAPSSELWLLEQCNHAEAYNAEQEKYDARVISFFSDNLK